MEWPNYLKVVRELSLLIRLIDNGICLPMNVHLINDNVGISMGITFSVKHYQCGSNTKCLEETFECFGILTSFQSFGILELVLHCILKLFRSSLLFFILSLTLLFIFIREIILTELLKKPCG